VSARLIPGHQPDVRIMRDLMASTLVASRFRAMLIGAFSIAATVLAAVGLYATMTHFVERRRRELAIRMALGGNRADVIRMVLGRGLRLSAVGLSAGVVAAITLNRVLRGLLFGVEFYDPATLALVVVVLLLVSAAAAFLPARRATAVNPVAALRME
jgi:putative ABC transport system permease protein